MILSLVYFDVTNVTESKDMSRERTSATSVFADILCGIQKKTCVTVFAEGTEGGDFDFHFFETPSQIQLSLDLTT